MKHIICIPQTILSHPAKPVVSFDRNLASLIRDMKAALRAARNPKGVGLAAPQIGVPLRIFVTRPTEKHDIRVFINPEILHTDHAVPAVAEEKKSRLEGCLSIPAIWGNVHRAPKLTLKYQDETGKEHVEEISGFLATIVQHETDHVNGILFTQRALEQKNKLYQTTKDEKGKEVLEEITL